VYLILELASEGELFDRVIARGAFPEAEARALVYTIANTVQFLHEKGIMHRDLKPENVLFARDKLSNEEIVKLADFGFASCYDANSTINMDCGSGEYAAPELLNKKLCTLASDIWSIGVH
jgi:serine/threonine protein kinase